MKKLLKWRVVFGYRINDYVQIGEEKLELAKYAMITGKIFSSDGRIIRGTDIKRIEPDVRYYTGWNDSYQYGDLEDMAQIERDCPMAELNARANLADERVAFAISNKKEGSLLSDPTKILPR